MSPSAGDPSAPHPRPTGPGLTYAAAGVHNPSKDALVERITRLASSTLGPQVLAGPGPFAGLYSLKGDGLFDRERRDPVLVGCADGVGTKLKLAFLTGKHDTVGIDLVAMNVNDAIVCGARPLFFLDYFASGKLELEVAAQVLTGIAAGCREAGCALLGGETAELPDFYAPGEYDLAGFAVGVVERNKIIDGAKIVPGDVVVGMASTGLHSNGYSLARKVLLEHAGLKLDSRPKELGGCTLAEELLRPTRIYVRAIQRVIQRYKVKEIVKGLAHITGGGLVENLPRVLPAGTAVRLKRSSWPVPPIFGLIQRLGGVEQAEMDRVFNQGVGMVLICPAYNARAIIRTLGAKSIGVPARVIGEVVKGQQTVEIV